MLRGMALTWGEGRRLKRIAATAGEVTFAYDSDGKRVRKTSGGIETKYYYNGNVLSGLVRKAANKFMVPDPNVLRSSDRYRWTVIINVKWSRQLGVYL